MAQSSPAALAALYTFAGAPVAKGLMIGTGLAALAGSAIHWPEYCFVPTSPWAVSELLAWPLHAILLPDRSTALFGSIFIYLTRPIERYQGSRRFGGLVSWLVMVSWLVQYLFVRANYLPGFVPGGPSLIGGLFINLLLDVQSESRQGWVPGKLLGIAMLAHARTAGLGTATQPHSRVRTISGNRPFTDNLLGGAHPAQGLGAGNGLIPVTEDNIAQLEQLGFSRAQAEAALQRTANNVDAAADMLFSQG
ncbi:uncharacterized protein MONBRDRAFT_28501 [Monosiga brevicollis MX1]|uniref:UBA domain-containing protein n=1 Tax=Monosiga brevicollis TaxID=81824 RepID=A9V8C5_MONBE|nr:uncharacterized protein MONBRDRAFT_28501 [Monosiga brevicollis MX1]EDQ86247.1 predicted protein [Monosiga brevicollis MX1]|eukprot:XP_001748917.1 hypothetical protein [Monosiga brevicollis MX1]